MKTSQGAHPSYHYSHLSTLNFEIFCIIGCRKVCSVWKIWCEWLAPYCYSNVPKIHSNEFEGTKTFEQAECNTFECNSTLFKWVNRIHTGHLNDRETHSNTRWCKAKAYSDLSRTHSNDTLKTLRTHLNDKITLRTHSDTTKTHSNDTRLIWMSKTHTK